MTSMEPVKGNERSKRAVEEVAGGKVRLVSGSRKWFCYKAWRAVGVGVGVGVGERL